MKVLFIILLVAYLIIVISVSIFDIISRYKRRDGMKDIGDKYLIHIDSKYIKYFEDDRK